MTVLGLITINFNLIVFDRNTSGGDGTGASSLRRPTIVKREFKIDHEVERKNIQDILGDNDNDMDTENEGSAGDNGGFTPIALHERKYYALLD